MTTTSTHNRELQLNEEEWRKRYHDIIFPLDLSGLASTLEDLEEHPKHAEFLPEVTLSAFTETDRAESSILVPNQRSYIGNGPAIPSSLANTRCADLGAEGVLEKLNATLGTAYTLEVPCLSSLLEAYITKNYDFGAAYARLRPIWYNDLTTVVEEKLRTHEIWDREMRQKVLVRNTIISMIMPPRRVWDLYSNRVVPWHFVRRTPYPISHAWMEEKDREDVLTPINGHEWPVPIPKDANLDLIRIEMLNIGAEYAWLDVLCLRQVGGEREDLRLEEWKVDVPTIGCVYQDPSRMVVCYFSGLGRPLSLKADDFESDWSWFRRAWTLQEVNRQPIIGGDTGDNRIMEEDVEEYFKRRIMSFQRHPSKQIPYIFEVLREMRDRVSKNPVDKVAGLAYLLGTKEIPAYYETHSEEDAWTALVRVLSEPVRARLLMGYDTPGNGYKVWRPSWRQVMNMPEIEMLPPVDRTEETDADWYRGLCIHSAYVQGLVEGLKGQWGEIEGKLIIKKGSWANRIFKKRTFKISTTTFRLVPDGFYTLLGCESDGHPWQDDESLTWAVGIISQDQEFRKVLTVRLGSIKDRKRLLHLPGVVEISDVLLA
ncbi:hypothetical protein EV421DRAFT_1913491 [Armillaria borealis]|uniref:Heterokaryon incompatibility domain-containing protein n=1 Tax=Armillaria borealis TaxID=47425 RepID=A0AA39MCR4_9AGAR|nr:hypothetical protein EV421DRAFT_1913491 [Armillaria borealis]